MHQGKTYVVKELDISEKIALCYEANLHYYTKTRDYTDIDVLGGDIVCLALKSLFFFLCFSTCI
jgi:DEAD/DEAH box helicase domain-containing protein